MPRDLEREPTAEATLQAIVAAARELVEPCVSAGITLASRHGEVKTSVATDATPTRSDELQIEHREGPCRDAVWEHHTVVIRNLPYERRWRRWAPAAADELAIRSMLCLRLFTHGDRLGALNLFSPQPDAFDEESIDIGHTLAAHAAVAAVGADQIEHLEKGLVNRAVIGQATGVMMNGYNMSSTAAFEVLVRLSSTSNRKLSEIAREIVSEHDRSRSQQQQPPRKSRRMPSPLIGE